MFKRKAFRAALRFLFSHLIGKGVHAVGKPKTIQTTHDFSAQGFEHVLAKLDLLHDLASEGRIAQVTVLDEAEIQGWLQEITFLAQETIHEMESRKLNATWSARPMPLNANRPHA